MTMEEDKRKENNWFVSGEGGDKGGGPPIEEPDTLRSRAEASILVALCEGEAAMYEGVEGETDEDKANNIKKRIFLDDTPLVSAGGSKNFNTTNLSAEEGESDEGDVQVGFTTGTQAQGVLSGFQDIRIEQSVGAKVSKNAGAVSATTTSTFLERIIIRMSVGSLFKVEDDGDIKADRVAFNIKIFNFIDPEPIVDRDQNIFGKSRGPFEREFFFNLSGTGPWTVKVKRLTPDAKDLQENNDLFLQALIGIVSDKLTYPNTALLGLKFSASSFSSVPKVSTLIKGLKIKVPTGMSEDGVWDGSFTTEYSNNPVWVFYDMLTNPRYGAGEFVEAEDIDIYSLQEIAAYCDEMVPDGKGGSEKRFEFNGVINNRAEAYEVLNAFASAFRGMIYFAQGQIMATQDRPASAVKQFNPANVVIEVDDAGNVTSPPFVYEGTGLKARKTVALVSWNDKDDKYKSKVEYVEDQAGLAKYGFREIEIRGFGITSQAQARRLGLWTLLTNLNETETVTFRVAAEGFFLMPGEIIEIADPYKNPGVAAGLVSASSEVGLVLDREVMIEEGKDYEVVVLDSGMGEMKAAITSSPGMTSAISVAPSFTELPATNSPFVIRESSAEPRLYKVMSLAENDKLVTVLATQYFEDKYSLIDQLVALSPSKISVASTMSMPPVIASTIRFEGL